MKKIRMLIKVSIFVALILGIIAIFSNAEKMMPNYEGKIIKYDNDYFENNKAIHPMQYIENTTIKRTLTEEEKSIFNIEGITSLFNKNAVQEDTVNIEAADMAIGEDETSYTEEYVVPETKYGDIICKIKRDYLPNRQSYTVEILLFTKDLKNIYYSCLENSSSNGENIEIDKEKLIYELQLVVDKLKIPVTKFEPTILKIGSQEYLLKDEKQNLQIMYDVENKQIKEFSLNF